MASDSPLVPGVTPIVLLTRDNEARHPEVSRVVCEHGVAAGSVPSSDARCLCKRSTAAALKPAARHNMWTRFGDE
jgi:hypothetical protein